MRGKPGREELRDESRVLGGESWELGAEKWVIKEEAASGEQRGGS